MIQVLEDSRAKLTLIFLLSLISLYCLNFYKGSGFLFLIFSITFIFYIFRSLTKTSSFFSLFTCGFLCLGFYFKLNIHLATNSYIFGDDIGSFSFSANDYNQALIAATAGILGFIAANEIVLWLNRFPRKSYFLKVFDLAKKDWDIPGKYIVYIGLFFIVTSLIVNFANFYFKIYQRGVVSAVPGGIRSLWTVLLMFGLSLLFATLIQINYTMRGRVLYFVLLAMIDASLTSISMLSRAFVLFAGVFILAFWHLEKGSSTGRKVFHMLILISTYLVLTIGTVKAVTEIRHKEFSSINGVPTKAQKFELTFFGLLIGRWVGFEGVMSATSFKGDRDLVFKKIWDEKIGPKVSIYDSEIAQSSYIGRDTTKFNFVTVPGIVGWLSIRDSIGFIFFGCLAISIVFYFIEHLFSLAFNSSWISAVVGHVLAFRIAHFGYVPKQTYKLFLGLVLFGLVLCLLIYALKKLFPLMRKSND